MRPNIRDDSPKRLGRLGIRVLKDERLSGVPANHDPRVEWDPTEERQPEFFRGRLAPSDLEDVGLLAAVRADETAHVLDHAQDVHLHGLREGTRLTDIE